MDIDRILKNKILVACYDALEKQGFTRFSKYGVDYPIQDGFHCWVGLNVAIFKDRLELTPNVGLHVVPIEELISNLDKGEYSTSYDRGVATYSLNIGALETIGEEQAFAFSPQQSDSFIQSECNRLALLYSEKGLEFAKSISTYESLAPLLKKQVESLGGNPERYAACLYLMDKKQEAREFLNTFPTKYQEFIKGFSKPLLERIEKEID